MSARLATHVLASALIRLAEGEGGTGMVLARGDRDAGGLIVLLAQRGDIARISERGHDLDGRPIWHDTGGQAVENQRSVNEYVNRRRSRDRDLWVVELNVADTQRFAAQMAAMG